MISVRTFGGFSVWSQGKAAHHGLGAGGRGLAAYLFVNPGIAFRRERLLDLFWGDQCETAARRAMNTAIWRLRGILRYAADGTARPLLVSDAGEVMLCGSERIEVDSRSLETCIEQLWGRAGRAQEALGPRDRQLLKAAVGLYNGPFLDGLDGDWVLQARERLHCIYVRGLLLLMADAAAQGDFEGALDAARQVLAADPLRESVQRHVMRLYVLNGQRAEAIRQFERCRCLLDEECGVEPMPQTNRLHEEIRSGAIFAALEMARAEVVTAACAARPGESP